MGLLDGKSGLITGGGRGIAGATASMLAAEGAQVVVADYGVALDGSGGDASVAQSRVDAIRAAGGEATAVVADVTQAEDCDHIVETCLKQYGKLDFIVTAAGILRDRMMFNTTDAEFESVLNVHLKGTFFTGRAAGRVMRQQRFGSIVTVTSSSQAGNWGQSNYAGAKGGIASMTYTWAQELGRYGVNVNSVAPTAWTRMTESVPGMEAPASRELGQELEPGSPMGSPEQVAPLFIYLCSDAAKWLTGQVIGLGGERLALWQHPRERIIVTQRGGFSVADVQRSVESAFQGQLEPYGQRNTEYQAVDYEKAQGGKN